VNSKVKIYKQSNNGNVSVLTTCKDAEDFIHSLASAMESYIENKGCDHGDYKHDITWLLSNGFEIILKLKGYKNDGVSEKRMLFAGDHWPTDDEKPDAEG
jgi:hypothetical protein